MISKYIKSNLLLFIASYLVMICIFSFTSYNFFISDFLKFEEKQNQQNINTILSTTNTHIENIKKTTNDYSKWDDTYYFIANENEDYIYNNFREGTSTLEDLDIDFFIYLNLEQKTVFHKYTDNFLKKNALDFEKDILKEFKNNGNINTIFKYKSYYLYLIKSEIKESDSKGKANGYIFSGKIINNEYFNSKSKVFEKLYLSQEHDNKNDLTLNFSHLKNIQVKTIFENSLIKNIIQIYNVNNNYVFSINTENRRDIVNNGQKTIIMFNLITSVFLFIILYIVYRNKSILEQKIEEKSRELIENQKLLSHQSKMAAMGEMLENIAHQWRQPLNALSLVLQNIHFSYKMDELDAEYMDRSIKKVNLITNNMSKTIDDFRNFFKPNKEKEEFLLDEIVTKSLSMIESTFKHADIDIKYTFEKSVSVYGFPNEFSQVILNILNNSRDAYLDNNIENQRIDINIKMDDNYGYVIISDYAGGIPLDIIDKIFDAYFTTKDDGNGTGIGLYMSKTIIENNMSGKLKVRNIENGVEFTIQMPLLKP